MLVHLCDHCHKELEGFKHAIDSIRVVSDEGLEYSVENKEFCSLHCQRGYIINGMRGRGLAKHIRV